MTGSIPVLNLPEKRNERKGIVPSCMNICYYILFTLNFS